MKTKTWTIWDKVEGDYGFTVFMDVPVFRQKKAAQEIVRMWNKQAADEGGRKYRYKVVEVIMEKKCIVKL